MITETEAYKGPRDRASHAFGGRRTARVEPLYADGGTTYVYLVYGMHWLLNFSTAGAGNPEGVLIRGILASRAQESADCGSWPGCCLSADRPASGSHRCDAIDAHVDRGPPSASLPAHHRRSACRHRLRRRILGSATLALPDRHAQGAAGISFEAFGSNQMTRGERLPLAPGIEPRRRCIARVRRRGHPCRVARVPARDGVMPDITPCDGPRLERLAAPPGGAGNSIPPRRQDSPVCPARERRPWRAARPPGLPR